MRNYLKILLINFIIISAAFAKPVLISGYKFAEPDTVLHIQQVEEIKFTSGKFEIAGNLYLPGTAGRKHPLVIWVSGSGPSFRKIQSPQTKKLVNCFLDEGIAFFRIDKPGSGDSKGNLNDDSLFAQLSDIVVDATGKLKQHPEIDGGLIGLFGSSQAGYIMPLAVSKCKEIKFMMGSSCPGENSINQWNYLIGKQMVCDGYTEEKAKKYVEMFSTLRTTSDKNRFDEAVSFFEKNPMIIKSINYDSSFVNRVRNWWPRELDPNDESHFNPITLIERFTIPVFMVYGEKDTQINPVQAIAAYEIALKKSGSKFYRLKMLKGTDHNMSITTSGCLQEIQERNKSGNYHYTPEYFSTIKEWIREILGNYIRDKK
jgi:uncharacterized protein